MPRPSGELRQRGVLHPHDQPRHRQSAALGRCGRRLRGRVTSLLDRASGREWMTAGGQSPQTGDDAVYLGDEAVAWDECFPTVGRCNVSATPWRRTLRDHGELWAALAGRSS